MSSPLYSELTIGQRGSQIIDGTDEVTGSFGAIVVLNDSVIAAITAPNVDNSDGLVGKVLFAGTQILATITSITLTSGVVQAYRK